jgi:hypothetical protein
MVLPKTGSVLSDDGWIGTARYVASGPCGFARIAFSAFIVLSPCSRCDCGQARHCCVATVELLDVRLELSGDRYCLSTLTTKHPRRLGVACIKCIRR